MSLASLYVHVHVHVHIHVHAHVHIHVQVHVHVDGYLSYRDMCSYVISHVFTAYSTHTHGIVTCLHVVISLLQHSTPHSWHSSHTLSSAIRLEALGRRMTRGSGCRRRPEHTTLSHSFKIGLQAECTL